MKNAAVNHHSWRDATYISQVPELTQGRLTGTKKKRPASRSPFKKCSHYICTDRSNGSSTTGIVFPNGRVYVGDDVWRLSNRADCCDYPYRRFNNQKLAEQYYDFKEAERSILSSISDLKERRYQVCV